MLSRATIYKMYQIFVRTADPQEATRDAAQQWTACLDGMDMQTRTKKKAKMLALAQHEPHRLFAAFVADAAQMAASQEASKTTPAVVTTARDPARLLLNQETDQERVLRLLDIEGRAINGVHFELEQLESQNAVDTSILLRVRQRLAHEMTAAGGTQDVRRLVERLLGCGRVDLTDLRRCAEWLECSNTVLDFHEMAKHLKTLCDQWVKERQSGTPRLVADLRAVKECGLAKFFLDLVRVLAPGQLQAIDMYPGLEEELIVWVSGRIGDLRERLKRLKQAANVAEMYGRYDEQDITMLDDLPWSAADKRAAFAFCALAAQIDTWKKDIMPRAITLVNEEMLHRLDRRLTKNPDDHDSLLQRGVILSGQPERQAQGLADLDRLIELDPSPDTYLARGSVLAGLEHFAAALRDLNTALADAPPTPDETTVKLYVLRASVQRHLGAHWLAWADLLRLRALLPSLAMPEIEQAESAAWLTTMEQHLRRDAAQFLALATGREKLRQGDYAGAAAAFAAAGAMGHDPTLAQQGRAIAVDMQAFSRAVAKHNPAPAPQGAARF